MPLFPKCNTSLRCPEKVKILHRSFIISFWKCLFWVESETVCFRACLFKCKLQLEMQLQKKLHVYIRSIFKATSAFKFSRWRQTWRIVCGWLKAGSLQIRQCLSTVMGWACATSHCTDFANGLFWDTAYDLWIYIYIFCIIIGWLCTRVGVNVKKKKHVIVIFA